MCLNFQKLRNKRPTSFKGLRFLGALVEKVSWIHTVQSLFLRLKFQGKTAGPEDTTNHRLGEKPSATITLISHPPEFAAFWFYQDSAWDYISR